MPADEIHIRPLTRADERRVREIVRAIWGSDDYIPEVFARWVREGDFFGAEVRGKLVGMGKLSLLSPTEAWLEGLRVAPRWRRRGIARALISVRLRRAADRGARIVRFSTGNDNEPMHRLAASLGFRRLAALQMWLARAEPGARPTRPSRAAAARLFRAGTLLQLVPWWRWRALTRADLVAAARRGRLVALDRAFAIVARGRSGSLYAVAHAGTKRAYASLLRALCAEARRRRAKQMRLYVPLESPLVDAFRAAGYRRARWAGPTLYERRV